MGPVTRLEELRLCDFRPIDQHSDAGINASSGDRGVATPMYRRIGEVFTESHSNTSAF